MCRSVWNETGFFIPASATHSLKMYVVIFAVRSITLRIINMSCNDGISPLCNSKVHINLQLSQLLELYRCVFRYNLLKVRAKQCYFHQIELRMCKNQLLFASVRRIFPIFASKLTCI